MNRLNSRPLVLAAAALALVSLACQTVTQSAEVAVPTTAVLALPTAEGQVEPPADQPADQPEPAEAGVLFFDDFSDPDSGWDRTDYDGSTTDYLDGQYQILVTDTSADFWANPGLDFGDVHVETLATKAGGPDDNDFGVICRYQDLDNFYYFVISSDGYAGIIKLIDGENIGLGSEELEPTDAILQGDSTNLIEAECVGSTLRLYVNGELVAEAEDTAFSQGDVGLIAGTYDIPGTDIRFDDFLVTEP